MKNSVGVPIATIPDLIRAVYDAIIGLIVSAIVRVCLIVIIPTLLLGVVRSVPPEHGVLCLPRPKYSRYVKQRYLKW